MNNNKIKNLMVAGIAVLATFQIASAAESNLVVVNDRGKVLLLDRSAVEPRLHPVQTAVFPDRFVGETYFVPSYGKILICSDSQRSYELDLNNLNFGYRRIGQTSNMASFTWFDRKNERPAGLCYNHSTNNLAALPFFQDSEGRLKQSNPSDIEFPNGFAFSMVLDKDKTSSFFNGDLQQRLSPEVRVSGIWAIGGRSQNIAVYGLIVAESTKDGEQFKYTLVFHDRMKNKWHLLELGEAGKIIVYDSTAAVRGMFCIKGDREPNNGNYIQPKPTGNWYFFSPFKEGFFKLSLNPSWVAYYATADEAFFAGDGKLMSIALWGERNPKPKILAELPDGFSVVAICPFTAPSQTNATPPAAKTRTL